jgi:hypothetical protein
MFSYIYTSLFKTSFISVIYFFLILQISSISSLSICTFFLTLDQRLKTGAPRGRYLSSEGQELFERHLFCTKYGCKIKYIFWQALSFVEMFTYHLVPNYKQHISSPAKVRKVCYSLAELFVKPVY